MEDKLENILSDDPTQIQYNSPDHIEFDLEAESAHIYKIVN